MRVPFFQRKDQNDRNDRKNGKRNSEQSERTHVVHVGCPSHGYREKRKVGHACGATVGHEQTCVICGHVERTSGQRVRYCPECSAVLPHGKTLTCQLKIQKIKLQLAVEAV